MFKIGRNDPCYCGSGKKYKKCCGRITVVSMESVIEKELHEIQHDILLFAVRNYQRIMDNYLNEQYKKFDIPKDAMEIFSFFGYTWFITSVKLQGKTILEEYINRYTYKYNRQRTKDILQLWKKARPSLSIVLEQEGQTITVEDFFTKEVQKVKILEDNHDVETGGLIMGTILPAGATSIFFTTFLNLPAHDADKMSGLILELFSNSEYDNSADFMNLSYLDVLELFLFGKVEVTIEDLEWSTPIYRTVAEKYQEFMKLHGHEQSIINLGVHLWYTYCARRNPVIKKSSIYEAALVYLVSKIIPYGSLFTQKELAEAFSVSSSSISSKFKDLEYILDKEIREMNTAMSE